MRTRKRFKEKAEINIHAHSSLPRQDTFKYISNLKHLDILLSTHINKFMKCHFYQIAAHRIISSFSSGETTYNDECVILTV